jgi:phosphoribosylanthranilate isomerase
LLEDRDVGARTRIKFCGMTRVEDVRFALGLDVDAVGLVFAARSPRCIGIDRAVALREAAGGATSVVALVMDNPVPEIEAIIERLRPDLLQFHGGEDDIACAHFGIPFLKALPMRGVAADAVPAWLARYPSASGFVFDGHAPGTMGGSGERFDWDSIAGLHQARPWLLAGGLDPSNVGPAVRAVRPWGVDVSSGIESLPGVKDHAKMRAFAESVRRADEDIRDARTRHDHD